MSLQKFGTPEPIEPESDPEKQGVDTEAIRPLAGRITSHEVVHEDEHHDFYTVEVFPENG